MNFSGQSDIYSRKYRLRKAPAASSVSHKEIHGAGYKGKGHYRGDRFQMGCQERFQGVTGEKPDQIGTGTGQKKPGGHREQVYEAVGVWQDKPVPIQSYKPDDQGCVAVFWKVFGQPAG